MEIATKELQNICTALNKMQSKEARKGNVVKCPERGIAKV